MRLLDQHTLMQVASACPPFLAQFVADTRALIGSAKYSTRAHFLSFLR